jgi:hypothetical protein
MNKQLNPEFRPELRPEFRLPDPVLVEPIADPRLERELMRRRIDQLTQTNQALQAQFAQGLTPRTLPSPGPNRRWAVRQYPWSFRTGALVVWSLGLLLLGLVMALLVEGTLGWTEAFNGTLALTQDLIKPLMLVLLGIGVMLTLRDQLSNEGRRDLK